RADHLVVAPAIAVEDIAFSAALPGDRAQIGGELTGGEETRAALQQLLDRSTDVRCDSQGLNPPTEETSRPAVGFECGRDSQGSGSVTGMRIRDGPWTEVTASNS